MSNDRRVVHQALTGDLRTDHFDLLTGEEFDLQSEPELESDCDSDMISAEARLISESRSSGEATRSPGRRLSTALRVLVVEDDFTSRVLLQSLLLEFGTVHIAVDGIEAIHAFCAARKSGAPYGLICMDVRMPEMNGMDALQRIRMIETQEGVEPSSAVKIFMTTGVRDLKTVSASFNALCDAYLSKPLDARKLISEMRQHNLIK